MLPRWHIIYGILFTTIIWYFVPSIGYLNLALVLLSSILIDFDHYVNAALKTKKLRLKHSLKHYDELREKELKEKNKGIRVRGPFHLFHTVEFLAFIAILGIFFVPFFYIFVGMTFHSLLDLIELLSKDRLYRREYFLFNWLNNISKEN